MQAIETMTREQLVEELTRVRNKRESLWNRLQRLTKEQLVVEIIRLKGKHYAHCQSLRAQQKAILVKNARIATLETQLGYLALAKAVEQPEQVMWSSGGRGGNASVSGEGMAIAGCGGAGCNGCAEEVLA